MNENVAIYRKGSNRLLAFTVPETSVGINSISCHFLALVAPRIRVRIAIIFSAPGADKHMLLVAHHTPGIRHNVVLLPYLTVLLTLIISGGVQRRPLYAVVRHA